MSVLSFCSSQFCWSLIWRFPKIEVTPKSSIVGPPFQGYPIDGNPIWQLSFPFHNLLTVGDGVQLSDVALQSDAHPMLQRALSIKTAVMPWVIWVWIKYGQISLI